ncbi:MAG: hypothetical protein ACRELY_13820 [Polyangiaceae bacterium]
MRKTSTLSGLFAVGLFLVTALVFSGCIFGGGDDSNGASADGGGDAISNGRRDSGTAKKDSGSTSNPGDGGLKHDDAGHVILPDGGTLVCEPGSLSGFTGGTYKSPVGPYADVCNSTDFTNYVACIGGTDTSQCAQFESGGARSTCGACLLTPESATHWGATVGSDPTTSVLNIPGCYALAFDEGTSVLGCGGKLQYDYNCQDYACNPALNCSGATSDEMSTCDNDAISGVCSGYADNVNTACAKDAGGLDNNCNVTDSTSAMTYLNFFCGVNGG